MLESIRQAISSKRSEANIHAHLSGVYLMLEIICPLLRVGIAIVEGRAFSGKTSVVVLGKYRQMFTNSIFGAYPGRNAYSVGRKLVVYKAPSFIDT